MRRRPDIDRPTFLQHWRDRYGPIVADFAGLLGIGRYVQNHPMDTPLEVSLARLRGSERDGFDGIAELWFDSEADMIERLNRAEVREALLRLLNEEAQFIDLASSTLLFVREEPLI